MSVAYALGGDLLVSDLPLPELAAGAGTAPRWTIVACRDTPAAPWRTVHTWRTQAGDTWLTIGRNGRRYGLTFSRGATFIVDPDERHISWTAAPDAAAETIRHLLLDQVMPLALSAAGSLVLHASAVHLNGYTIGFVGESGAGKSTVAAAFASAGGAVVADDCVLVSVEAGAIRARGAYPGVRLWPDAAAELLSVPGRPVADYTDKLRFELGVAPPGDSILDRLYLLDVGDAHERAAVSRLAAQEALIALVRYTFRMDPIDRRATQRDFERIGDLAERGIVRRLSAPRRLAGLDDLRARVLADLASDG